MAHPLSGFAEGSCVEARGFGSRELKEGVRYVDWNGGEREEGGER